MKQGSSKINITVLRVIMIIIIIKFKKLFYAFLMAQTLSFSLNRFRGREEAERPWELVKVPL